MSAQREPKPISDILSDYWKTVRIDSEAPPEVSKPHCDVCGGLGLVNLNLPVGHPDFGKLVRCPDPNCPAVREQLRDHYARVMKHSGLIGRYNDYTFETFERDVLKFDPTTYKGRFSGMDAILDHAYNRTDLRDKLPGYVACKLFVEAEGHWTCSKDIFSAFGMDTGTDVLRNGLVLYGEAGTGKTGLAASIMHELADRRRTSVYTTIYDLIQDIQSAYSSDEKGALENRMWRYINPNMVLIVDEVNVHNPTNDRVEKFQQIINDRYAHRAPTILTTNLNVEQFKEQWGFRSESRISDAYHWIYVGGSSLRSAPEEIVIKW